MKVKTQWRTQWLLRDMERLVKDNDIETIKKEVEKGYEDDVSMQMCRLAGVLEARLSFCDTAMKEAIELLTKLNEDEYR